MIFEGLQYLEICIIYNDQSSFSCCVTPGCFKCYLTFGVNIPHFTLQYHTSVSYSTFIYLTFVHSPQILLLISLKASYIPFKTFGGPQPIPFLQNARVFYDNNSALLPFSKFTYIPLP